MAGIGLAMAPIEAIKMSNNIRRLEVGNPIEEQSKFSLVLVGNCPSCGAPIWIKKPENNFDQVPENLYSCSCRVSTINQPIINQPWSSGQPWGPMEDAPDSTGSGWRIRYSNPTTISLNSGQPLAGSYSNMMAQSSYDMSPQAAISKEESDTLALLNEIF